VQLYRLKNRHDFDLTVTTAKSKRSTLITFAPFQTANHKSRIKMKQIALLLLISAVMLGAVRQQTLNVGQPGLPTPLQNQIVRIAGRPHSQLPTQAFAEADGASQLFQYYLLDTTGFQPNVFTTIFPGVNDHVQLTVTGPNCGLPTIGPVRVVLEPKPGLPTDPNNPRVFIDVFTDISGLFVFNNESGWYEGWMIHDLTVAPVNATPRRDGHAQFGTILPADAAILKQMGSATTCPATCLPSTAIRSIFQTRQITFLSASPTPVPLYVSMGTYNSLQQSDAHAYWEFNYLGTNWVHPLYELPFTAGFPDNFGRAPEAFQDGEIGKLQSIIPGSGPRDINNRAVVFGDNPTLPRDPDKFDGDVDAQREFRDRNIRADSHVKSF
jgi:hypothetical protein